MRALNTSSNPSLPTPDDLLLKHVLPPRKTPRPVPVQRCERKTSLALTEPRTQHPTARSKTQTSAGNQPGRWMHNRRSTYQQDLRYRRADCRHTDAWWYIPPPFTHPSLKVLTIHFSFWLTQHFSPIGGGGVGGSEVPSHRELQIIIKERCVLGI